MPKLIPAIVEPGTLAATEQPRLSIDEDLELRPFRSTDAPAVVAAFSTPDIRHYHSRSLTLAEALGWIEDCAESWQAETSATWAVTDRSDGTVAGRVTTYTCLAEGHGEVSYWILPDARGRGVATRACVAVTSWAHDVGLPRIELQHSSDNGASRRVALRAGFVEEGTKRQAQLLDDGWHDMVLYSHLATDGAPGTGPVGHDGPVTPPPRPGQRDGS